MKVKTKYNVGQKLYLYYNDDIKEMEVCDVKVKEIYTFKALETGKEVEIIDLEAFKNKLFTTEEELINSL